MLTARDPGSFRDPAGFVFSQDGVVYRQVNAAGVDLYRHLMRSGLYEELVGANLLVSHEEVSLGLPGTAEAAAVIKPAPIPFISYPYEWCFSQLKAAALLTLDIQRRAVARGMTLRDASAYNVQFVGSRPLFIDSLSFAQRVDGKPWVAYRQFCRHFLAPLALMALTHESLHGLGRLHIDGVPLDLTARLLPLSSRLRPGLLLHLHLHARAVDRVSGTDPAATHGRRMGPTALSGLIDSLIRTVDGLECGVRKTLWSSYADHHTYSPAALEEKERIVRAMMVEIATAHPVRMVWDFGANTGVFSAAAAEAGAYVVAFDSDHASVQQHFRRARNSPGRILPLVQDLANPSSSAGWNAEERRSLMTRGPADVGLALALVHHLAIGSNVPLESVASFFAGLCRHLVIEFVPKDDSQVQRMLRFREHSFDNYEQRAFERAFDRHFQVGRLAPIPGTQRTLYLMARRT